MKPTLRSALHTLTALSLLALAGCATSGPRNTPNAVPGLLNVALDGDTHEWPIDSAVAADEHFVYFRMTVENEQFTLQSAPESLVLLLDVDASTATGRTSSLEPLNTLGVDMEIRFSPMVDGKRKSGVALCSFDEYGNASPLSMTDLDFLCSPTFASSWYEARISRTPAESELLPFGGLRSSGALSGLWAIEDETGKIVGYSDPFTIELTSAAPAPMKFIADLPAAPRGAIRVMTMNVENTSTVKSPAVFGRLFQAVNPDVVLVQEWNDGDADQVQSWFTALVPHTGNWYVHKPRSSTQNGGGVAIVSKFPLEALPDDITCSFKNDNGETTERPVRFAAARLDTPIGDLIAGSLHLKCCGTKDSREDRQRMEEARAIAASLQKWSTQAGGRAGVIVGGDMNLVGTRPPLDLVRAQSDSDGSDLSVADAFVLGDRSMYTWVGDGRSFAPGRLDYMMYSDARFRAVNTFILDTTRLGEESLARLGLDATDSAATDHRPVVVDLLPR